MLKNRNTQIKRDVVRAATIKKTADTLGVSTRFVQLSLNQEKETPLAGKAVAVFMEIYEGENILLQQVKALVPFL